MIASVSVSDTRGVLAEFARADSLLTESPEDESDTAAAAAHLVNQRRATSENPQVLRWARAL
jgi:hypothetical protein